MPIPAVQCWIADWHVQKLQRRLLSGHDHVDVMAAAQAVVGHRKQRVSVRRQIHAHHIRFLVHHQIHEARILVREAVMVLSPHMRGEQIIQRRNGAPPGNSASHLQPLGMLVEHRIHDVNEGLVAGKKSVPSGKQIAFQPALAHVLAEHFHHTACDGEVLVRWQQRFHRYFVGRFVQGVEAVGSGFIGTENTEIFSVVVQAHHVAQEFSEFTRGFRIGRAGLHYLHAVSRESPA